MRKVIDVLMDDEIKIVGKVEKEKVVEEKKEGNSVSGISYRNVAIETGSDVKVRVLDIVIVIVAIILAYMLYTELM